MTEKVQVRGYTRLVGGKKQRIKPYASFRKSILSNYNPEEILDVLKMVWTGYSELNPYLVENHIQHAFVDYVSREADKAIKRYEKFGKSILGEKRRLQKRIDNLELSIQRLKGVIP